MTTTPDAMLKATGGPTQQGGLASWYSKTASEGMHDAERRWLISQGGTKATNQGMWNEILKAAGYVGTTADMLNQYWVIEAGP